jgi:hypothetical protein
MAHRPKIKVIHGRPSEIEAKFTLWAEEQMGCASIISVTQSGGTWEEKETVTLTVIYEEDEKAVAARLASALEEDRISGGATAIVPLPDVTPSL